MSPALPMIHEQSEDVPLVEIRHILRSGAAMEPAEQAGAQALGAVDEGGPEHDPPTLAVDLGEPGVRDRFGSKEGRHAGIGGPHRRDLDHPRDASLPAGLEERDRATVMPNDVAVDLIGTLTRIRAVLDA